MASMKCGRCGSEKVMPDLRIRPRHEGSLATQYLAVEVQGNPDALIFKEAHTELLRASVCGECGHVGLSVENPQALWQTYSERKNS